MIKQTWNIDEDERNRILNLHESATKNLYLIKEQQVKIGEKITTTDKNFELDKKSFPAGFYSINKLGEGKKIWTLNYRRFAQFAQENNGSQVNIQIEVGESKVTNFDNELKKPLAQGEAFDTWKYSKSSKIAEISEETTIQLAPPLNVDLWI